MAADVVDVIYRLRDMAGAAADTLRPAIAEAQAVLDKLEAFADGAEHAAQLTASSDAFPEHHALAPASSGLVHFGSSPDVSGTA